MPGRVASLPDRIARLARRQGSISFAEFVEWALYDPEGGFYELGGRAGRRGDFLTSPEVGPLFGAVIAHALDSWWDGLGRPDPYILVEAGAGAGTLARSVLDAAPACAPALRYVLVERSAALREAAAQNLRLELPAFVLGPATPAAPGEQPEPVAGTGPLCTVLPELPAEPIAGTVLANELLDNLPFLLLERAGAGWLEVRVGSAEEDERLVEVLVPAAPDLAAEAEALAPAAPVRARVPVQHAARAWLPAALGAVDRGRVVVLDYAGDTPAMAGRPWAEWLRTYRSHGRGGHPLDRPGGQDITCEVAVDQLSRSHPPTADRSQAEFLASHGLDDLEAEARAAWQARAHVGDLEALRWRSRLSEAAALRDPAGLGAFRVLEWEVG